MKIKTCELKAICETLCQYLEQSERSEVTIDQDYYWHLHDEQQYDPAIKPVDLTLGQLTDDWNELQKIVANDSPPIGYAFVWLSSILRAVGINTVH